MLVFGLSFRVFGHGEGSWRSSPRIERLLEQDVDCSGPVTAPECEVYPAMMLSLLHIGASGLGQVQTLGRASM